MHVLHFWIRCNELAVNMEIIQDLSFCHPAFKFIQRNLTITDSAISRTNLGNIAVWETFPCCSGVKQISSSIVQIGKRPSLFWTRWQHGACASHWDYWINRFKPFFGLSWISHVPGGILLIPVHQLLCVGPP